MLDTAESQHCRRGLSSAVFWEEQEEMKKRVDMIDGAIRIFDVKEVPFS